jgi:glycerol-3-phosphate dehydrogenase
VLEVEVVNAVQNEMAVKLADVVLRRTELGTLAHPGAAALCRCAEIMAPLCGWSASRVESELAETEAHLTRFWARPAASADR